MCGLWCLMRDSQEMMVLELSLIQKNQLSTFSVPKTIKITLITITVVELINSIRCLIPFANRAMYIRVLVLEQWSRKLLRYSFYILLIFRVIMRQYLHTDKLVQERHSQWRVQLILKTLIATLPLMAINKKSKANWV